MHVRPAAPSDMEAVYAIRLEVFVQEQNVPLEEEYDDADATARHYIAEEAGVPVGCARLLTDGDGALIGRVAVRRTWRGRGVGAALCRRAMEDCRALGCTRIRINAQVRAIGFYEKLGFRAEGEVFLDAGIDHRRMELTLSPDGEGDVAEKNA